MTEEINVVEKLQQCALAAHPGYTSDTCTEGADEIMRLRSLQQLLLNQCNAYSELRKEQARKVMPLIGPLLDAADAIPNDLRDKDGEMGPLLEVIEHIHKAMDDELCP